MNIDDLNEIENLERNFAGAQEWFRQARTRDERYVAEAEMLRLHALLQVALLAQVQRKTFSNVGAGRDVNRAEMDQTSQFRFGGRCQMPSHARHVAEPPQEVLDHDGPRGTGSSEPSEEL